MERIIYAEGRNRWPCGPHHLYDVLRCLEPVRGEIGWMFFQLTLEKQEILVVTWTKEAAYCLLKI
jgi:hypothetical protein